MEFAFFAELVKLFNSQKNTKEDGEGNQVRTFDFIQKNVESSRAFTASNVV
jgi:hypothetical protein